MTKLEHILVKELDSLQTEYDNLSDNFNESINENTKVCNELYNENIQLKKALNLNNEIRDNGNNTALTDLQNDYDNALSNIEYLESELKELKELNKQLAEGIENKNRRIEKLKSKLDKSLYYGDVNDFYKDFESGLSCIPVLSLNNNDGSVVVGDGNISISTTSKQQSLQLAKTIAAIAMYENKEV